ncbi:MAG: magnetochrome domain-containing protein [Magnetospirillum sp. WYHS-4]
MNILKPLREFMRTRAGIAVLVVALALGLGWAGIGDGAEEFADSLPMRYVDGVLFGKLPTPTEPSLFGSLDRIFRSEPRYKLMTVKHIPRIQAGQGMPHPYVGECSHCHLYLGGPGPGTQPKTPVGAILERLSQVRKLGPPLRPTSHQPHPPAGRCIKCHDIVVKVPVDQKKGGFLWNL